VQVGKHAARHLSRALWLKVKDPEGQGQGGGDADAMPGGEEAEGGDLVRWSKGV
jgi:hypothetical protein